MNRRNFGGLIVASAAAARGVAADEPQAGPPAFGKLHGGKQPVIGMLMYPGMTLLDLLGPQTVFSTSAKVHLVWKTKDPITTDSGIVLRPDTTLAECPRDLDVLFVGGGLGQTPLMTDPEIVGWLADRGSRAKYVTSVCSGSLLLGAAGLLKGYKATSHWACRDALKLFGTTPVNARVVTDRNRITGGGVTAGIDFGLVVLTTLCGEETAKLTQLSIEYDPAPPFHAGSPEGAGPELTRQALEWMAPFSAPMIQACEQAGKALNR